MQELITCHKSPGRLLRASRTHTIWPHSFAKSCWCHILNLSPHYRQRRSEPSPSLELVTAVPNGSTSSLAPVSLLNAFRICFPSIRSKLLNRQVRLLNWPQPHFTPLSLCSRYTDAESGGRAMSPLAWNALTLPDFPPLSFASPKSTRLYV